MNRNLDVWAIQKYPKELYTALENVKTDTGDLILFTNLECNFELNGKRVKRNFDTSLYYDAGNGNDDRNISPFQAHRIMEELGVSVNVHSDSEFNIEKPYQGKMMEKK